MAGGEAKKNMFYSHSLLSKKGSLGTIWIAAHCFNKLKRKQIEQTNVCSSVDKILRDEVPVVTYRILAYLLLGNVRIYSKKVEYLFNECRDALSKLLHFASNKKQNAPIGVMLAPHSSIVVPERFELDTFDLELIENERGDHMSPDEDIALKEKAEGSGLHSFDQHLLGDDDLHFEGISAGQTGFKDMCLPFAMTDDVIASTSHDLRDLDASIEKICNDIYSVEKCLPPMLLDEAEEVEPERTFLEDHETNGDEIESPHCEIMFLDDAEPEDCFNLFDEQNQELTNFTKMTTLENENIEMTSQKDPVALSIDVTPELKVPNTTGVTMPDFLSVITPATREGMKKQKIHYDEKTIITQKLYRKSLRDSRHLIRRQRTRRDAVQSLKANQMANLPQSFWAPLIPCISINFKQQNPEQIEAVETRANFDKLGIRTSDHRPPEEEGIGASTPVTHSTSLRFNDILGVSNSEREAPASSFETIEKDLSLDDYEESDVSLINEELNSCKGDSQEKDNNWSVKTSAVASYLHENFLTRKKRGEDEVVNLSQISDRKTKKESARLFYELLVLKTGGFVEVKQDHAYADISVVETAKLKQTCEADD